MLYGRTWLLNAPTHVRLSRCFGECKQKDTRTENTEHKQRKLYLNGIFVLLKVIEMIVLDIYSNLNTSGIFFKDSSCFILNFLYLLHLSLFRKKILRSYINKLCCPNCIEIQNMIYEYAHTDKICNYTETCFWFEVKYFTSFANW